MVRVMWLHEPGAFQYIGFDSEDEFGSFRQEMYPGLSDAEILSRWSRWTELDHTIRWFDVHGRELDHDEFGPGWYGVSHTMVNPEPGVFVLGRYHPPPFGTSPEASKHLLEVTRCPVALASLTGVDTPCSTVVGFQAQHEGKFQVPTPWIGHLDEAPILFIGANPSISFNEDYPTLDTSPGDTVDAFHFAFDSAHGWIRDGNRQRLEDGSYSKAVAFWSQVKGRAKEVLDTEDIWLGHDYCITEIVRCRSQSEVGVCEALDECAGRWLDATLSLSPAPVLIVLGKNAGTAIRDRYSLGSSGLEGPVEIAGWERLVVFLAHPNAHQPKTIRKVLGEDGLDRLRSFHAAHRARCSP